MGDQHRVEGGGAKKQAASYNRYNLLDSSAGKEKMGAKPKKKKKMVPTASKFGSSESRSLKFSGNWKQRN